jgi:hypothetical protein
MLEFHDPRAEPGAAVEPYELATDPYAVGFDIGLVANGFPDSEPFLDMVEKSLAVRLPHAVFHRYNKHNASSVISDQLLETVVSECRAVVAAYGH